MCAACSALTSLDDLRGGSDAASDVADVMVTDAPLPTSDGAAGFCNTWGPQHSFCADWDQPQATAVTAWNDAFIASGTASVTSSPVVTSPAALSAFLPDAGTGIAMSAVAKTFASSSSLHCAFDMHVVQTSTGQVGFADLFFDSVTGADIEPALDASGAMGVANGNGFAGITTIDVSAWNHFDWTFERTGATTAGVTLALNGKQAYFNAQVLTNVPTGSAIMGVSLGFSGEGTRNWVIAYDDLVCDVH